MDYITAIMDNNYGVTGSSESYNLHIDYTQGADDTLQDFIDELSNQISGKNKVSKTEIHDKKNNSLVDQPLKKSKKVTKHLTNDKSLKIGSTNEHISNIESDSYEQSDSDEFNSNIENDSYEQSESSNSDSSIDSNNNIEFESHGHSDSESSNETTEYDSDNNISTGAFEDINTLINEIESRDY